MHGRRRRGGRKNSWSSGPAIKNVPSHGVVPITGRLVLTNKQANSRLLESGDFEATTHTKQDVNLREEVLVEAPEPVQAVVFAGHFGYLLDFEEL